MSRQRPGRFSETRQELQRVRAKPGGPEAMLAERAAAGDKGGWLAQAQQDLRLADTAAAACRECAQARTDQGDELALCATHLARALGF